MRRAWASPSRCGRAGTAANSTGTRSTRPRTVERAAVAVVREEWRVVDRWWTEEPVDRRYFEVVLETGENRVVFRDEELETWFAQRGA